MNWTQEGTAIYQGDCKIAQCLDNDAGELYGDAILPRKEYRDLLVPYETAAQHARLIAAAPDLLAALQDELAALDTWSRVARIPSDISDGIEISRDKITRAIAKATNA